MQEDKIAIISKTNILTRIVGGGNIRNLPYLDINCPLAIRVRIL